jgi:hypothetical protein
LNLLGSVAGEQINRQPYRRNSAALALVPVGEL